VEDSSSTEGGQNRTVSGRTEGEQADQTPDATRPQPGSPNRPRRPRSTRCWCGCGYWALWTMASAWSR